MGTIWSAKTFPVMPTSKEFRQTAEDCLKLARETDEVYAKTALIEMATEFRVMAEHLDRDTMSDRIRQRITSLWRSH